MALADPRRPKQKDVSALSDPAVTGSDGAGVRLGQPEGPGNGPGDRFPEGGNSGEVKGVECLAGKHTCLNDMALYAASVAFCQFVFHQSAEQTGRAPALFTRLFGKARPATRNCGL